jgi:hypothetical protein
MKSVSELETELRLVRSNLKSARGDRALESSLKKRERELTTDIQRLKMFVMGGFG